MMTSNSPPHAYAPPSSPDDKSEGTIELASRKRIYSEFAGLADFNDWSFLKKIPPQIALLGQPVER